MSYKSSDIALDPGLSLEMECHSYIHDSKIRNPSGAITKIVIGKFCSIATNLTIIGYDHHSEWITTYPFLDDGQRSRWSGTSGLPYPGEPQHGSNKNRGDIAIGNDVWVGFDVKLFKGVTIGDGAIVGACSVVNKSVPAYTIVAGIPARPIRKRFSDDEIEYLQKLAWWDWSEAKINRLMPYLCSSNLTELEMELTFEAAKGPKAELLARLIEESNNCLIKNDLGGSLEHLTEAVQIAPRSSELRCFLGRLYLHLNRCEDAKKEFSSVLSFDPKFTLALAGLGRCHLESGAIDCAVTLARQALEVSPADEDARQVLSEAMERGAKATDRESVDCSEGNGDQDLAILKRSRHDAADARRGLREWWENSAEVLKDVEPPELTLDSLTNSRIIPSRDHILQYAPKGGVCAEVGTQTGAFAQKILTELEPLKLHLFDLDFTPFDETSFLDGINSGTVKLHEGDSAALLSKFPDKSFDFIYIDGDHSYEGCQRDLQQADLKIKDGGWIVCNDYTLFSPLENKQYGVYRAVNELCLLKNYEIIFLALHPWGYHDVVLRKKTGKPLVEEVSAIAIKSSGQPKVIPGTNVPYRTGTMRATLSSKSELIVSQEISAGDEMYAGDKDHYFRVGTSALHCIDSALRSAQKGSDTIRSILDLPCGHGRVMRFLKARFVNAELTACDLNKPAVDFCAQTFGARGVYSDTAPAKIPLGEKYDLIWCGSLLTHLTKDLCEQFIVQFHKWLKPGGLAIFTLHGRCSERLIGTGRYRYGLSDDSARLVVQDYREHGFGYADYPGVTGYGISACQPGYALAELVRHPELKLVSYQEMGWDNHQYVVCLEKLQVSEKFLS